jgi:signal transduction histidine kinase/DNA-binding response OmpR family regulator
MRRGSLTEAMQQLATVSAATLGIERVSFWRVAPDAAAITCLDAYDTRSGQHTTGVTLTAHDHPAYFEAICHGGEIVVEDITKDPRTVSFAGDYAAAADVRSMLDMPILSDGATVGIVCAEKCGSSTAWSLEQRLFLAAVTNLAALVIERDERQKIEAEVAAGADRLSRQLAAINALMESETVRAGSLKDALRALSKTLCVETEADLVTIRVLPTESNDPGYAEAYNGRKQRHERVTRSPGFDQGAAPNLDIYASTFAINDIRSNAAMMERYGSWVELLDVRSAMQVPIMLHGTVTGAIRAMSSGRMIDWRPDQKMLVTAIAQLVALVVERHNRLRIERNLRHANRAAEQASKAKSQFLANMSHEIRTPMNGVFGMTDLLMQTELTVRQRRLVGTVHESAKTLLTLINDILDLSRIESGKMELEQQPFNLRHCLEGAVELFAEDAQRKGIELNLFVSSQAPEHVEGDSGRLRQICVNLIGNALKFTTTGEVSIRVSSQASSTDGQQLQFEIRDTGIGIDPAVKVRLFQPFVQADDSITRRFGGTGLGLSISHHLVVLMNGTIAIESQLGQGTTVAFSVPVKVAAASRCVAPADHSILAGKRILVIDDRDSNREIMVDYLTAAGAQPVNARSAELGFDLMTAAADAGHPFAGAIVDMLMPGINGLELCRTVRGDARLADMGLVLVTSMSWDGDSRNAREAGVHQLLTKPVRRGDLLDAVCRALAQVYTAVAQPMVVERKFKGHILVAEDNPVNEEVAREFVTSLGCTITTAANGALALAAFKREHFDLVLMDCQMPEMDGLTATQHIREFESNGSKKRTPIVAVTANAFAEDRIACLNAGMDDYLSKPFSERQLAGIFAQWLAQGEVVDAPVIAAEVIELLPAPSMAARANLDEPLLAEMRQKRPQLLARLLSAYLTHAPKTVAGLSEAELNGNIVALRLAAHSLKSSSANVGAKRMSALSRRIEALVGQDDLFEAKVLVHDLELEFSAVTEAFSIELEALKKAS